MAVITVEVPDAIARQFKPFSVVSYEKLVWGMYFDREDGLEFDFKNENIDQDEFLRYLQLKNGKEIAKKTR